MKGKILVISVHPDDETLGCGGTMLRHKDEGYEIYWLIITNVHIKNGWSKEIVFKRTEEIRVVASKYEVKKIFNLEFPTTKLDTVPLGDLIKKISEVYLEIQPEIIYTINRSDIHSDHRVSFNAILSCSKNFRSPFLKRILMYESLSETEFSAPFIENAFLPNVFVDITDFLERKLEIMTEYTSELMTDNLPRSHSAIKALAAYRGSRIGVKSAEAFMLLFEKL